MKHVNITLKLIVGLLGIVQSIYASENFNNIVNNLNFVLRNHPHIMKDIAQLHVYYTELVKNNNNNVISFTKEIGNQNNNIMSLKKENEALQVYNKFLCDEVAIWKDCTNVSTINAGVFNEENKALRLEKEKMQDDLNLLQDQYKKALDEITQQKDLIKTLRANNKRKREDNTPFTKNKKRKLNLAVKKSNNNKKTNSV